MKETKTTSLTFQCNGKMNMPSATANPYFNRDMHLSEQSESGRKCNTFFHLLTEEALYSVIRFVSREPRSDNWTSSIHPEDALNLLRCEEPIASCARRIFRTLEYHVDTPHHARGPAVVGPRRVTRDFFYFLVSAAEVGLQEIRISRPVGKKHKHFLHNCSQIRTITLDEDYCHGVYPLKYILNATNRSVRTLNLSLRNLSYSDVNILKTCSAGLKSLRLQLETVCGGMDNVWPSLGGSLEDLSLSCSRYNHNPFALANIGNHCPNITKLDFEDFPIGEDESIASLCVRYGTQLRSLRLYSCGMDRRYLGKIAMACKNVSLDFAEWGDICTRSLPEVGPLVSSLEIFDREYDVETTKTAFSNLENLHRLVWNSYMGVQFTRFRHLLLKSRSKLDILHIYFRGELHENAQQSVDDVFRFISGSATSIEEFTYHCSVFPKQNLLRRFVLSSPRLRKLHFEGPCSGYRYTGRLCCYKSYISQYCKIISTVLEAPMLKDLRMCCRFDGDTIPINIPEIADACFPARKRNICISVCRFVYS